MISWISCSKSLCERSCNIFRRKNAKDISISLLFCAFFISVQCDFGIVTFERNLIEVTWWRFQYIFISMFQKMQVRKYIKSVNYRKYMMYWRKLLNVSSILSFIRSVFDSISLTWRHVRKIVKLSVGGESRHLIRKALTLFRHRFLESRFTSFLRLDD